MRSILKAGWLAAALAMSWPAVAQDREGADRTDPAVIAGDADREDLRARQQPRVTVAAPELASAAAPRQDLVAGAIRIAGARAVSIAAFGPAIEPYLGRTLEQADLTRLATDVASVMRRAGYGLATAWVPAQDMLGGVLVVQVEEGRIDSVRATGPGARLVEQRLSSIVGNGPIVTEELERQLMLVGDMAGIWVGEARLVREGDRSILTVATRYQRSHARLRLDNWGTGSAGPVRAWAEVDLNGLLTRGDGLTLGAAITPLQPDEFQFAEARYRLPVGTGGTTVAVAGYLGRSATTGSRSGDDYEGDSSEIEVEIAHPLQRSRARSLWLTTRIELRNSQLLRDRHLVRDDRVTSATVSLYGWDRFAGGRIRGRLSLVQGLDLFDATQAGEPAASRSDAGGVFTKFEGWAEYWRGLGGGFSIELAGRAQVADGPLLSSEEEGLGGPQFLRAFDYRERSGDEGFAASAELRFDLKALPKVTRNIQFYGYADAGYVRELGFVRDSGSLASAGGGVRVTLRNDWELGAEVGVPLTDGEIDRNPDPRFSFTVLARF